MPPAMTIFFVVGLCLVHLNQGHAKSNKGRYGQYDPLFVGRCEAMCWKSDIKKSCMKSCLAKGVSKPGYCPSKDFALSPFAAVCLETCRKDSQCPELTKCCQHNCGSTCQHPQGLLSVVDIPEIPNDIYIREGRKKRIVYIEWKPGESTYLDEGGGTVYLVEERHHIGKNFIEKKMSEWLPCGRSVKTTTMKYVVNVGRWYQFRIAAINKNGTKGFSDNSIAFTLSSSPKPPNTPKNVTLGPVWMKNGTYSAYLRWLPPKSDLPIKKYKVFWSKRLHGVKALDSVYVQFRTIPKEQNEYIFENLHPNSLYFLQVQALVQFGKEKLEGDKFGVVLNTSLALNVSDNNIFLMDHPNKSKIEGFRLQKLYQVQGKLKGKVMWTPRKRSMRYTVTWWLGHCQNGYSKYSYFAATTKVPHFEIHDLQFGCRYRVSVRETSLKGLTSVQETSLSFTTPKCKEFKAHHKKLNCEK